MPTKKNRSAEQAGDDDLPPFIEEWAHADECVRDPRKMKRWIRKLRIANDDSLSSDDPEQRAIGEWFCSEEHVRDIADPASFLDGLDERFYGGGPPVCHPYYGDRRTQETLREIVRALREAALQAFPTRSNLEEVHKHKVIPRILNQPYERWTEGWAEQEWIAFLYKGAMRTMASVLRGVAAGEWPHAFRLMASVQEDIRAMTYAASRPRLMQAKREEIRSTQLREAQQKGAAARRKFSDSEKQRWRTLYAKEFSSHTLRRAAGLICQRLELDAAAIETIRKALSKKAGRSL